MAKKMRASIIGYPKGPKALLSTRNCKAESDMSMPNFCWFQPVKFFFILGYRI